MNSRHIRRESYRGTSAARPVDLKIKTDAATITFLGNADPDGLIRGSYRARGGSCDLTGTGNLSMGVLTWFEILCNVIETRLLL